MDGLKKSLRDCLLNYYPLEEEDILAIEAITTEVNIPRNTIIIEQDKLQHDIYILSSGLASRLCFDQREAIPIPKLGCKRAKSH